MMNYTIKSVIVEKERDFLRKIFVIVLCFQKGYLANLLTREGYAQNLQYFRSPVDYHIELGKLVYV